MLLFHEVKKLLIIVGDSQYILKEAKLNPNSKLRTLNFVKLTKLHQQGLIFYRTFNRIFPDVKHAKNHKR